MDGCRCVILANRHFARCLQNEQIEVVVYEQNDKRTLELVMIVKDFRNASVYIEFLTRR